MYNFENEVGNFKNRDLQYFIGSDYFHDGTLHHVGFVEDVLELVLSCEREWVADYNLEQGYSPESKGFDQRYNDKYMYRLIFLDCKLFEANVSDYGVEYINGRFKDTAQLKRIRDREKKEYYHLRIQLSEGYLDIIFNEFKIEKVNGEIILPSEDIEDVIPFDYAINRFKDKSHEEVRYTSINGDWFDRYLAIQYLSVINDPCALECALVSINHEEDEVKLAAIHVVGKYANSDVVPMLLQMWLESDQLLLKKHIIDNVEKIYYRSKNNS